MPSNLIDLSAQQLRKAASIREKIDALEKQLEVVLGTTVNAPKPAPAPKAAPKKLKRQISKAARAAMSKRLKERWATRVRLCLYGIPLLDGNRTHRFERDVVQRLKLRLTDRVGNPVTVDHLEPIHWGFRRGSGVHGLDLPWVTRRDRVVGSTNLRPSPIWIQPTWGSTGWSK